MTWFKVENNIYQNPKILAAGSQASWLFLAGLGFCAEHLTDGFIPTVALRRLIDEEPQPLAATLVEVELWDAVDGGYQVHDYVSHQRTKDKVLKQREDGRARQERYQAKKRGVTNASDPHVTDVREEKRGEESNELADKAAIHSRLKETCDAVVVDGNAAETLAGYLHVSTSMIPEAAQRYSEVSGIGEASLQNLALSHAANHFIGEIDSGQFRRLAALRKSHGTRVYEALVTAAVAASGDPISYATSILKKEAAR